MSSFLQEDKLNTVRHDGVDLNFVNIHTYFTNRWTGQEYEVTLVFKNGVRVHMYRMGRSNWSTPSEGWYGTFSVKDISCHYDILRDRFTYYNFLRLIIMLGKCKTEYQVKKTLKAQALIGRIVP